MRIADTLIDYHHRGTRRDIYVPGRRLPDAPRRQAAARSRSSATTRCCTPEAATAPKGVAPTTTSGDSAASRSSCSTPSGGSSTGAAVRPFAGLLDDRERPRVHQPAQDASGVRAMYDFANKSGFRFATNDGKVFGPTRGRATSDAYTFRLKLSDVRQAGWSNHFKPLTPAMARLRPAPSAALAVGHVPFGGRHRRVRRRRCRRSGSTEDLGRASRHRADRRKRVRRPRGLPTRRLFCLEARGRRWRRYRPADGGSSSMVVSFGGRWSRVGRYPGSAVEDGPDVVCQPLVVEDGARDSPAAGRAAIGIATVRRPRPPFRCCSADARWHRQPRPAVRGDVSTAAACAAAKAAWRAAPWRGSGGGVGNRRGRRAGLGHRDLLRVPCPGELDGTLEGGGHPGAPLRSVAGDVLARSAARERQSVVVGVLEAAARRMVMTGHGPSACITILASGARWGEGGDSVPRGFRPAVFKSQPRRL